jgi:transposase
MNIRYRVALKASERVQLVSIVLDGTAVVRKRKRAQILLAADSGLTDQQIAKRVAVGTSTVHRTKQRFVKEGMERALNEALRAGAERKFGASDEALLIAVVCSKPPSGRARWTLRLLAEQMGRLTTHQSISDETIRRRLKKLDLKLWHGKISCIPKGEAELVARMEDAISDAHMPIPAETGTALVTTTTTAPQTSSRSSTSSTGRDDAPE